jgi:hypothetical protein
MPCPLAGYRIDEKAARVVAGLVLLLVVAALFLPASWARLVYVFLVLDFGVRAFSRPRWSPLGRLAGVVLRAVGAAPSFRDAGPKRFAARIGLGFALALLVLTGLVPTVVVLVVAGILILCAALESIVGFCVGCQVWTAWYAIRDRLSGPGNPEP